MPISNPDILFWLSPWEEASIAAKFDPLLIILKSSLFRDTGSGVVSLDSLINSCPS